MPAPNRAPVVCGALGAYDRERVLRLGASSGNDCQMVHEDGNSILLLDREPLRWSGGGHSGLGWIDGSLWRDGATSWEDAARRGACGLVLGGRRRFLHSSVNGLGPIYWLEDRSATYFASRIEPLVVTKPGRLSVDWDAWAAIIAMRFPLGERTPFAEIRRLGPSSTLRRRFGRGRMQAHRWPWAEIDPGLSFEHSAEATAAALREVLAVLDGEVTCPLSGGLDSRLLLGAIAAVGQAAPLTLTVSDDEGARFEQELAAPVAQLLDVSHEELAAQIEDYPRDWNERALRVEHQFVDHAWLVPLARRIEDLAAPVLDGFALDTLTQTGARFHRPDVIEPSNPRAGTHALFDSLRQYGLAHEAMAERFWEPIVERTRAQFEAVAQPFEGHPSQPILALYAARTVRGISTYPSGLLGQGAQILCPGVADQVAAAILSASSEAKRGRSMHASIEAHLAPQLAGMPSTGDTPRTPPTLPRRWRSEPALKMHKHWLGHGPLAPHLSPRLLDWLDDAERGELSPHLRLGMEAISLFHSWCDRYEERLHPIDPTELLS
jgi:hypothetical protein